MKRLIAVVVAICSLLAVPFIVGAATSTIPDSNDTRGFMDVQRVNFGEGSRPRWKIVTFERWTAERAWDTGFGIIQFDMFGDASFDHHIVVWSNGSQLFADLYRDRRRKDDLLIGSGTVWRPNRRSVSVRISLSKFNFPDSRLYYRWIAKTLYIGEGCRRVCIDRVPDNGAVQTLRPGVEPTPTPTVTPTEPPSPVPSPTA